MEKKNTPLITVIIVYWNSSEHLPRCLNSLVLQTFQDFEVVIIDNGSLDGGLDEITQKFPRLDSQIEYLASNQGFAMANNLGVHLARGKWVTLLNADAFPEKKWLERMVAVSELNPAFASFSSRQLKANEPKILDGTGDAYHVSGLAWRMGLGYPAGKYGLKSVEIFSPCAAAAMYLRDAFLDVGGFDEDFFSYFEDVDLGFRLQLKGYRSLYVHDAVVHHVGSATFGERSDFAFYHSHRNLIWTFFKNMPAGMFWRYLPAHIFANLVYLIYYSLQGRGRVLWRAKLDAIKGLSKNIRKRRETQKHVFVEPSDLRKRMYHGWLQPYLLGYKLRKVIRSENL